VQIYNNYYTASECQITPQISNAQKFNMA